MVVSAPDNQGTEVGMNFRILRVKSKIAKMLKSSNSIKQQQTSTISPGPSLVDVNPSPPFRCKSIQKWHLFRCIPSGVIFGFVWVFGDILGSVSWSQILPSLWELWLSLASLWCVMYLHIFKQLGVLYTVIQYVSNPHHWGTQPAASHCLAWFRQASTERLSGTESGIRFWSQNVSCWVHFW